MMLYSYKLLLSNLQKIHHPKYGALLQNMYSVGCLTKFSMLHLYCLQCFKLLYSREFGKELILAVW